MAFTTKIGNVLKRASISSNPSLLQAIRCMSSSKLFVGGLSYATDDTTLRDAFSHYGEVIEARVITDPDSGRSRGFGFITYTSSEEASGAITAMDGKDLQGRIVRVNYANSRAGGIHGGGGYGGGGYGGGGYGGGGYGNTSSGYAGSGNSDGSVGGGGYGGNNNNASGGGYGRGGGYNNAGSSDGIGGYRGTTGYNPLSSCDGGNYSTGVGGSGTFGGSSANFNDRNFGVADGRSYENVTANGGNGGDEAVGYGANKGKFNSQDDQLGDDFFNDKERYANKIA